jgi:hypothetical protein
MRTGAVGIVSDDFAAVIDAKYEGSFRARWVYGGEHAIDVSKTMAAGAVGVGSNDFAAIVDPDDVS